jgi:hypothetical protein
MADLESTRANSSRDGSDFFQSNQSVILHWLQLSGITVWLFETDLLFS